MTFRASLDSYFAQYGRTIAQAVGREYRADANESNAFTRSLEHVYSRTFDAQYLGFMARTLLPVNTEGGEADTFLYRGMQSVGAAKWIKDDATDFPLVDMAQVEQAGKYESFGDSYQFSDDQIGRAAFMGVELSSIKARLAREACERFLDDVAVVGGPGLRGFANSTEVLVLNKTSTPALTGDWHLPATTSDAIVADIDKATGAMYQASLGVIMAGTLTLALPLPAYQALRDKRVSTFDARNLLQFLTESGRVGSIESWAKLNTAGAGGIGRGVLYPRDPDVLELLVPKDFVQSEPQRVGFLTRIYCKVKTGGVDIHRPDRVRYLDQICP